MKIIEYMSDRILDELKGAEDYAEHALEYKYDYPSYAASLYEMSKQEYSHSQMHHDQAVKTIEEYRKTHGGEVPEAMKIIWDREHKLHIKFATKVKHLQEMYKES